MNAPTPSTTTDMELATLHAVADNLVQLAISRDQLVVRLRSQGVSLRVIAEAAGMSHAGVAKLLTRAGEVAP